MAKVFMIPNSTAQVVIEEDMKKAMKMRRDDTLTKTGLDTQITSAGQNVTNNGGLLRGRDEKTRECGGDGRGFG